MMDMKSYFSWPQYRFALPHLAPPSHVGGPSYVSTRSLVAKSRDRRIYIHDAASLTHSSLLFKEEDIHPGKSPEVRGCLMVDLFDMHDGRYFSLRKIDRTLTYR